MKKILNSLTKKLHYFYFNFKYPNWISKYCAATSPNTPPKALEKLANNKNWEIRSHVAENPNTLLETLEKLANDEDWFVRCCVAENPNTPEYLKFYLYFNS